MLLIGRWNQGKIVAKRFHWYLYHGGNIKAVFDQEPVFDGELKILEMNFAWWVILLNLQTCIWWDVFCNRVSNFERGQCNVWNWDCFKGWAKLSCLSHMLSGLLISAIKNTNVTSLHLNVFRNSCRPFDSRFRIDPFRPGRPLEDRANVHAYSGQY
jgi:hypothetical protein